MRDTLIILGERIRGFRKARNLTQEMLAEKANLHTTYISDIERGVTNASVGTLLSIANALEISMADLFSFSGEVRAFSDTEYQIAECLGRIRQQDKWKQEFVLRVLRNLIEELQSL